MTGPPRPPFDGCAGVRWTAEVAEGFFQTRLQVPPSVLGVLPGQFVQLRPRGDDDLSPYLRIPMSVAGIDEAEGTVDVLYDRIGQKTRALSRLRTGDWVGLLGPLGSHFPGPEGGVEAVLVGGGIGLPPLLFLGRRLVAEGRSVQLLAGARSSARHLPDDLLSPAAPSVLRATDDGSLGHHGLVTDLLSETLDRARAGITVFTCGPHAMMAAVARLCAARGVPCHASLEEYMACGFGVCVGCVVGRKDSRPLDPYHRYSRICVDGPVYDARTIEW